MFCIQCFYTVLETMNLAYGSLEMEKKIKVLRRKTLFYYSTRVRLDGEAQMQSVCPSGGCGLQLCFTAQMSRYCDPETGDGSQHCWATMLLLFEDVLVLLFSILFFQRLEISLFFLQGLSDFNKVQNSCLFGKVSVFILNISFAG